MRARAWIVAVVLAAAGPSALWSGGADAKPKKKAPATSAEPQPLAIDIKPFKAKLRVFQDGDGGTYVIHYTGETSESRVWFGPGKKLYEQVIRSQSKDHDAWSLGTWAPRLAEVRSGIIRRKQDGSFFKGCDGQDDAVLTELVGDKAAAVVAGASFFSPALTRRPHLLGRDDRGVYYYVDKLSQLHGGKGYRVFVGRKGAMKQLNLTDIASDSAGQIFSTKTGDLRLIKTTEGAAESTRWVKGGKHTDLIQIDLWVNSPLIFGDLGIYKFLGTICDNV